MQTGPIIPSLGPVAPAAGRFKSAENAQHARDSEDGNCQHREEVLKYLITALAQNMPNDWQSIYTAIVKLDLDGSSDESDKKSERILNKLMREYLHNHTLSLQESAQISINLHRLLIQTQSKENVNHIDEEKQETSTTKSKIICGDLNYELQLLNNVFNKHRILNRKSYVENLDALSGFREKYTLTTSEKFFRYAIALNAGMGSGSVIYGISTAIFMSPLVVAVSGGLSLAALGLISAYFLKSYTDEDDDLETELFNHELVINMLSRDEGILRSKCYELISRLRDKAQRFNELDGFDYRFKELCDGSKNIGSEELVKIDTQIDGIIKRYPPDTSTIAQVNDNLVTKYNSIFTRVFHSRHWGPVLNFFGSTGTIFGVTKTILALAGVATLMGSPILLPVVIAAAAITYSVIFSVKHWLFNKKSSERKEHLKTYRAEKLDQLKIGMDCLKRFKKDLKSEITQMDLRLNQSKLKTHVPEVADELNKTIASTGKESTTPSSTPSNSGYFARSNSANNDLYPEKEVTAVTPRVATAGC